MVISTSLSLEKEDKTHYHQLHYFSYQKRLETYWKCCTTFFSTSVRCNSTATHKLFTNLEDKIYLEGIDIKKWLENIGVEVVVLPFNSFRTPKNFANYHFSTIYKFDVLTRLAQEKDNFLLLDSDCIWSRPYPELLEILDKNELLLLDIYPRSDTFDKGKHGISRADMGNLYLEIDPKYPEPNPIWFGGEIVGGSPKLFDKITKIAKDEFDKILLKFDTPPQFSHGGRKFFDGEEIFASYIYNKIQMPWINCRPFIKRIWSDPHSSNIVPEDLNLPLWHMIGDKDKGIPELFKQAIDFNSEFWKMPLNKFNAYLGEYLGIPERKIKIKQPSLISTFIPKVKSKLRLYAHKYLS